MTAPILDFGFWIGSPHGKIQNPKSKIQNQEVQNPKSSLPILLLVGVVSLLVRLLLLWRYPFDGLYGQDAYFYLTATRDLVKTWTDPARLWDWLTVWGTPPISPWPLGYHLQMALVGTFTGLNATAGQLVSLVTGTLTPVLTSILTLQILDFGFWILEPQGQTIQNPKSKIQNPKLIAALLSGLVMAVSTLAVRSSLVVMSDMAGLFWATFGVVLAVRYLSDPRSGSCLGLLAGLCLGIASVTRYVYPLLIVPIALFAVFTVKTGSRSGGRVSNTSLTLTPDPKWKIFLLRMLPVIVPLALLVGLQLLHNLAHPMPGAPSPVIATWNPANAWQSQFDTPDGHQSYKWPMAYFFLARPLLSPDALGFALLPLFGFWILDFGFWILLRAGVIQNPKSKIQNQEVQNPKSALALLLGWWLLFAGFYSGNVYQTDRFVLSYLPPIAVLAGIGLGRFLNFELRILNLEFNRVIQNSLVVTLCLVGLTASALASHADFRGLYQVKEDYLAAVHCTQAAIANSDTTEANPKSKIQNPKSEGRPVFTFAVTFTLHEYTHLSPRDLYFETPGTVDAALQAQPPGVRGYLVMPPLQQFEQQWGATPMGATYYHLRDVYTLEKQECPGSSFTLFVVK